MVHFLSSEKRELTPAIDIQNIYRTLKFLEKKSYVRISNDDAFNRLKICAGGLI